MEVNKTITYIHQLWEVSTTSLGRQGLLASLNRLNFGLATVNAQMLPPSIHGDTRQKLGVFSPGFMLIWETPISGRMFLCFKCFQITASLDNC